MNIHIHTHIHIHIHTQIHVHIQIHLYTCEYTSTLKVVFLQHCFTGLRSFGSTSILPIAKNISSLTTVKQYQTQLVFGTFSVFVDLPVEMYCICCALVLPGSVLCSFRCLCNVSGILTCIMLCPLSPLPAALKHTRQHLQ